MQVKILETAFDPLQEIQRYQSSAGSMKGKYGATSIFIGTMRDFNDGDNIKGMTVEHYSGMTEVQLGKIITEAMQKWQVLDVLVVHRVGDLYPDDPIVLVAVWSAHRGDAFDVSRYIMEALKSKVPFWKKEILQSEAARWVDKNTDGYKRHE